MSLDFAGLARRRDPETSQRAARMVNANSIAGRILEALRDHGPATSRDLAKRLNIDLVSVSPRLKPLEDAGLVTRHDTDPEQGMTLWRIA